MYSHKLKKFILFLNFSNQAIAVSTVNNPNDFPARVT